MGPKEWLLFEHDDTFDAPTRRTRCVKETPIMDTTIVYWSITEIMKKYRIAKSTVYRAINEGRLQATLHKGKYYVAPTEVERWAKDDLANRHGGSADFSSEEREAERNKQRMREKYQAKKLDLRRLNTWKR